jgi:NAD-dependent deacetylase
MSTEGGLLDFRSASSWLWNNMNPANLATTDAMKYNRKQFIDFYRYRVESIRQCQPHSGHYILAEWEKQGIIQSIISQNVDGYHHYAGSKKVEELQGTLRTCHCNELSMMRK